MGTGTSKIMANLEQPYFCVLSAVSVEPILRIELPNGAIVAEQNDAIADGSVWVTQTVIFLDKPNYRGATKASTVDGILSYNYKICPNYLQAATNIPETIEMLLNFSTKYLRVIAKNWSMFALTRAIGLTNEDWMEIAEQDTREQLVSMVIDKIPPPPSPASTCAGCDPAQFLTDMLNFTYVQLLEICLFPDEHELSILSRDEWRSCARLTIGEMRSALTYILSAKIYGHSKFIMAKY